MAYGLKYFCEFDQLNNQAVRFRLEFLFKGYSGGVFRVMAGAVPVVQQYQEDNPIAPVKGSNLQIRLINSGALPISSFYSIDDDGIQVNFYRDGQLRFTGFLVQDDCTETMVDFAHELQLSATDGLGLLKDINFGASNLTEPNLVYKVFKSGLSIVTGPPHTINITGPVNSMDYTPLIGVPFTIGNAGIFNGTYNLVSIVSQTSTSIILTVAETVPNGSVSNAQLYVRGLFSMYERNNVLAIIKTCLRNTGLSLNIVSWCNLFEIENETTNSCLQQIFIDCQTFDGKSCYEVLSIVMQRFGLTLVQDYGQWQLRRTFELPYYSNDQPLISYNSEGFYITGPQPFDRTIVTGIGKNTFLETGSLSKIFRPNQYDFEKFDYVQPKSLIRNLDMKELGPLIREYIIGSGVNLKTYKEYPFLYWELYNPSNAMQFFVRVIYDYVGNELERYVVIKGTPFFTANAIKPSKGAELTEGDKVYFSFSVRTTNSQPGNINLITSLSVYNGITTRYANETTPNVWQSGPAWTTNIPSGDNTSKWHNIEMNPADGVPFDCLTIPILPHIVNSSAGGTSSDETQLKDFVITVQQNINQSTKIIGQTHKTEQIGTAINNKQDTDFIVDDSPRNSIAGTLFTVNFPTILQRRTVLWNRGGFSEAKKLGEIITGEMVQWRSKPRPIIDGQWRGLFTDGKFISVLSIIKNDQSPGNNFVFGTLNIDHRNNLFNGTLWAIYNDNDDDVSINYNFEYLYKTD